MQSRIQALLKVTLSPTLKKINPTPPCQIEFVIFALEDSISKLVVSTLREIKA